MADEQPKESKQVMSTLRKSMQHRLSIHRSMIFIFSTGAAMLAACASGKDSSDNVSSTASEIQGGQLETGFPAVGDVLLDAPDVQPGGGSGIQPDSDQTCTGILVHPSYVLTAKHCVTLVSFRVGTSPADFVTYPILHWYPHPTKDMILAQLTTPILTIAPMSLNTGNPPVVGATCTAVGFGNHNDSDGVTRDIKRSATERVESVDVDTITVANVTGIADKGDSGGPLLCGGVVTAIVRDHADGQFPSHSHEHYTPVDPAWVSSVLPTPPSIVVQRAVDGLLWAVGPDSGTQRVGAGLGMQPGTDVSVAALVGRAYEMAWNGNGQLWTFGDNGGGYTGYNMPGGATPAIAGLTSGGARIVFQNASDNLLWTIAADGSVGRIGSGLGIAAGTRPSIAGLAGGGYEIAWNGGGGQLWVLGSDNIGRNTGHVMAPTASPVVVGLSTGGAQIVYQNGSDNLLWTLTLDGSAPVRIGNGLGIAAGTRPALSPLVGGGYEVAWNGVGGQLWTLGPDNIGRFTGYLMRPDASPSIAPLPTGGATVAFAAETGFLWTLTPDGVARASQIDVQPGTTPALNPSQFIVTNVFPPSQNIVLQRTADALLWIAGSDGTAQHIGNGLGMEPGTDASIAVLTNGSYEIAWNGGGGQLWTLGADNIGRFSGFMMAPKATPAIVGLTTGGARIVFQNASDNLLWTIDASGAFGRVGNGLGIAAGTRIAIAPLEGGSYEIAWNGGGQLWTLGADNIGRFSGFNMPASASPGIAALTTGGTRIVFQNSSDNLLWTIDPAGASGRIGSGLGIAAGTRPGITALSGGGYEIAWNGGNGQLWTLGTDNIGRFTGYLMRSDNSPSVAGRTTTAGEVAFVADTGSLWALAPDGSVRASPYDVKANTSPVIEHFFGE